jgi:PHD/YefM family antitoxin component YafN of YafNO toxin-antitoxin module
MAIDDKAQSIPTLPITEAREQLLRFPDTLGDSDVVAVTRRGQPVLAILPWKLYEAIVETLDVMSDPDALAQLRQSLEDIAAGRTLSLADLQAKLGTSEEVVR